MLNDNISIKIIALKIYNKLLYIYIYIYISGLRKNYYSLNNLLLDFRWILKCS